MAAKGYVDKELTAIEAERDRNARAFAMLEEMTATIGWKAFGECEDRWVTTEDPDLYSIIEAAYQEWTATHQGKAPEEGVEDDHRN